MSHVAQSQLKGLWQWADKERKTLVRQVYSYTRTEKHTRLHVSTRTFGSHTRTYSYLCIRTYITRMHTQIRSQDLCVQSTYSTLTHEHIQKCRRTKIVHTFTTMLYACIQSDIQTSVHKFTCLHVCAYTYTHAYMQTYTCGIFTQSHTQPCRPRHPHIHS